MFDGELFVDGIQDFDEGLMNAYTRQKSYGFFENGQELFYELSVAREYTVQPCLYVTKLEFLQRNNILFGEGFIHEDEIFTLLVLLNAKRCLHINKPYFMRRLRPESTMTENKKVKKYHGYYQVFLAFNYIYEDFHFVNTKYKKQFTSHISYIFRKLITHHQEREVSNVDDLFIEIKRFGKNNKGYDVAGFMCL